MNIKIGLTFTLSIAVSGLFAQSPADYSNLKNKYPGVNAVVINDMENIVIDVEKENFRISEDVTKETLLLTDQVTNFANEEVYEYYFSKIKKIDAKTLIPDGNKYKIKKVENITESSEQSGHVFHDETIKKSFIFPALQPGAITSLNYVKDVSQPHYTGSFFFKWMLPCEISRLTIKADKRARLKFKLYHTEKDKIDFSQQDKGKYILYTWEAKNINAGTYESDGPNARYYFPHIVYYLDNSTPSDTVNGLRSLYQYYYGLIKGVNIKEDSAVKAEVNRITTGISDEMEKVKKIYYWVQENINYIAFEEGMQGLIPEEASLVYNKRYGDCKGMSSLLNYMLKLAGIDSHLSWVGTDDIPYKYSETPSGIVDNHMIVTYYHNGKPVFLDATNSFLPFGSSPDAIQGKEVLVSFNDKNFKIENVPVSTMYENLHTDSVIFNLKDNLVVGSGKMTLEGFNRIYAASYLTSINKDKKQELMLGMLNKGNNKFFLDTFAVENLQDREKPLIISYKFRINDYIKSIGDEKYINLNLNKPFGNAVYDSLKRPVPLENSNKRIMKYITAFTIPEGYVIENMPANKTDSCSLIGFDIKYNIKDKTIIQEKMIYVNFKILEPSQFNDWNKVINSLGTAYRDVLILKKKTQ